MTSIRKRLLIGISALSLAAGACTAYASGSDGAEDGPHGGKFAEHMKQRMEKHAAELHDKLHLNASQEAAWNTYITRMKPGTPPAPSKRDELDKMTAPERMEFMLARMKEHEQKMTHRLAATKEFYAVLTPEQKKIFDQNFMPRMQHHRR